MITVNHTIGNKQYELNNHLGNVLTTISDKTMPHNNGGSIDYFMADTCTAQDYSPFGVILDERSLSLSKVSCHTESVTETAALLEEGFGVWFSWTKMGDGLITYVSDEMQVSNPSSSKKNIGASKTFVTGVGLHSVSFDVLTNSCATIVFFPPSSTPRPINVYIRDNNNIIVASGTYTVAGSYNLSFTPPLAGLTYKIEFYITDASAFCFFRADNILISHTSSTTITVCDTLNAEEYRYGFNSMEKDDEVKGRGNSYDFGARMYDSRLGRFLSLDRLSSSNPYISHYAFCKNSPLLFREKGGFIWVNPYLAAANKEMALDNCNDEKLKNLQNLAYEAQAVIDELKKNDPELFSYIESLTYEEIPVFVYVFLSKDKTGTNEEEGSTNFSVFRVNSEEGNSSYKIKGAETGYKIEGRGDVIPRTQTNMINVVLFNSENTPQDEILANEAGDIMNVYQNPKITYDEFKMGKEKNWSYEKYNATQYSFVVEEIYKSRKAGGKITDDAYPLKILKPSEKYQTNDGTSEFTVDK